MAEQLDAVFIVADRYAAERLTERSPGHSVWHGRDVIRDRSVVMTQYAIARRDRRLLAAPRIAAQLRIPGVVRVLDIVDERRRVWIVAEHPNGSNLEALVERDGPRPPSDVASWGLQLLDTLDAAHAAEIVHGGINPHRVFVDGAAARLADIGVVGLADLVSADGKAQGRAFKAPEQLSVGTAGSSPSATVDLYGLGATMYFAVEAAVPFGSDGAVRPRVASLARMPRPPQRAGALAGLLNALLDGDPDARPELDGVRERLRKVAVGDVAPPASPTVAWSVSNNAGGSSGPAGSRRQDRPAKAARGRPTARQSTAPAPAAAGIARDRPVAPPGSVERSATDDVQDVEPSGAEDGGAAEPASSDDAVDGAGVSAAPVTEIDWASIYASTAPSRRHRPLGIIAVAVAAIVLLGVAFATVRSDAGGVAGSTTEDTSGTRADASTVVVASSQGGGPANCGAARPTSLRGRLDPRKATVDVPRSWGTFAAPDASLAVRHPTGWRAFAIGDGVALADPASSVEFRIGRAVAAPATEDALRRMLDVVKTRYDSFEQIHARTTRFRGGPAVVDEFRATLDGQQLRGYRLGARTGTALVTLELTSCDTDWAAARTWWPALLAGYDPLGI